MANPARPLIEPLNGEYVGKCEGENRALQIHTFRSTGDSSRIGSPFAAYDVRAQVGVLNDSLCFDQGSGRVCNRDTFTQGTYDFYRGQLELVGRLSNLDCKVEGNALNCGAGCRFERRSSESRSREFAPPRAKASFVREQAAASSSPSAIAGAYRGYVHHEYLDAYQPIRIDVATYQATDGRESTLRISAVATLFFGSERSHEAIAYRFEPRDYPNPILRSDFVLSRLDDDVDAFLKVTTLKDGTIRGEWYSLLFGRVGSFEAAKDGGVKPRPDARRVVPLTARYGHDTFSLDLKVFQGTTPPNTENPYYPLQLGGTMWFRGAAKENVVAGSYDFYVGRLALLYGDDRLFSAKRHEGAHLSALMTSNGYGTIMPVFEAPRLFKVLNEEKP